MTPASTNSRDESWMALANRDPSSVFSDPVAIVEITDLPYEVRLKLLQRWAALVKDDPSQHLTRERIIGATMALQSGAKLKVDRPEGSPLEHGYGVVPSTDIGHPGASGAAESDEEDSREAESTECKTSR